MTEIKTPIYERFPAAAVLAAVGGFLDAYTYCLWGGVFANAQTGNIVLLAVTLANGRPAEAAYYLIPILLFAAGTFLSCFLQRRLTTCGEAAELTLAIELTALVAVGFLPPETPAMAVNAAISFVCALQVNAFRRVQGASYASTMCTGDLRSGAEQLFLWAATGDRRAAARSLRYFGVIAFFLLGAALGTFCSLQLGTRSVWLCSAALTAILFVLRRN